MFYPFGIDGLCLSFPCRACIVQFLEVVINGSKRGEGVWVTMSTSSRSVRALKLSDGGQNVDLVRVAVVVRGIQLTLNEHAWLDLGNL